MEFGIFLNGYMPGPGRPRERLGTPPAHAGGGVRDLRRQAQLEVRLVRRAPLPDRVQPHVGARGRDGHWSPARPTTSTSHPASTACRPARNTPSAWPSGPRCSTTSPGRRYEWGTGRGAGSHELATFNILDTNSTKPEWDEVVREIPRMWEQIDYSLRGRALHRADAAQRAAQAVRPGPPADLGRLRQPAHVRQGRRARHRRDRLQLRADLQPAGPHRRLQGGASRTAPSRSASS